MQITRIFLVLAGLALYAWPVALSGQPRGFRKISPRDTFDVAVLMSTPAGVAAALSAARMGMRTALITETGEHLAMDTWQPDTREPGLRLAAGGIFREFTDSIRSRYRKKYAGDPAAFSECHDGFSFEPSVAEEVLEQLLLNQPGLTLFRDYSFDALPESLIENPGRGREIRFHRTGKPGRERWIRAMVWIDASEEGILAEVLGCRFLTDRESREETGELLAGSPPARTLPDSLNSGMPEPAADSLLPPATIGLCLTRNTGNLSPFREPVSYNRGTFAPLAAALRSGQVRAFISAPGKPGLLDTTGIPGAKIAARFTGIFRQFRPEPTPLPAPAGHYAATRNLRMMAEGLLYFARTDTALPEWFRNEVRGYGYARNEFRHSGHFPPWISWSANRRIRGRFIFLAPQTGPKEKPEAPVCSSSVASALPPDSPVRTLLPPGPFTIPYGVMLPADAGGLLCPVAVSASYPGMACLQSRHAGMQLGQAAGVAAALSVRKRISPERLRVTDLQDELLRQKARLVPIPDSLATGPGNEWIQKAALLGWLNPADARLQEEMNGADWERLAARTGFTIPELQKISPGVNRGHFLATFLQTYRKAWKGKNP